MLNEAIDTHTHIGNIFSKYKSLKTEDLIKFMDKNGILKSVVLPIENPEETSFYVTTKEVIKECRKYRNRLIPFCNVDPRREYPWTFKPYPIIKMYKEEGALGFGENLAGIPVDSHMNQKIYEACGRLNMPIVMHFDIWINRDKPGLRNFEKMLKKFLQTVFIGHGPYFWIEIAGNIKKKYRKLIYPAPKGKVLRKGRLDFLLSKYKNLYADLSANSGYNAITHDIEFGLEFLERNKNKLLFATDILRPNQETPIVNFLSNAGLKPHTLKCITRLNAEKLLKL